MAPLAACTKAPTEHNTPMATETTRRAQRPSGDTYRYQTLRPLNNLVFILPMLGAFQVGAFFYGTNLLATHHLRAVLEYFGATAPVLPGALVASALLVQHLIRRDSWRLQPKVLAGMLGESIVWMAPLIVMIGLLGRMQAGLHTEPADLLQETLQAFGAGIYEEFIFRLVFISLVLLISVDIFGLKREPVTVAAVLLAAVAFSLYHLSPAQLEGTCPIAWTETVFRAVAGIYLGTLYVFRGFGITVGAHSLYNIYAIACQ